jgi:hypothetical protein
MKQKIRPTRARFFLTKKGYDEKETVFRSNQASQVGDTLQLMVDIQLSNQIGLT